MSGAIAAGFMIQSEVMGELMIGSYAIIALLLRVKSRISFLLALMCMACVALLLIIRTDNTLAGTFSVYAFLFLVVGTLSMALERPRPYRARV